MKLSKGTFLLAKNTVTDQLYRIRVDSLQPGHIVADFIEIKRGDSTSVPRVQAGHFVLESYEFEVDHAMQITEIPLPGTEYVARIQPDKSYIQVGCCVIYKDTVGKIWGAMQ